MSMHRRAVLAAAVVLAACGAKPAGDDLFPLAAGHRWTYRMTTALEDHEPKVESLTIANEGSDQLGGDTAWRRRSDAGIDYWLRADDTGVYRIGVRTPPQRLIAVDEPRRYVLRRPYQLGTQWDVLTTGYVLQRRNEVPKELRRWHKPFPMVYTIAALDETVTTPAAKFEHCLRVDGQALVRVYVEERKDWREVALLAREWYCPGVGLVRLEREEPNPSRFMWGGRVTLELVDWR
jgi:hypothetical protein